MQQSIWRVNAGGPAYTDSQGNLWASDEDYSGGTAATASTAPVNGALPNPADQVLYQTQRYGASFSYAFAVPAGSYQVTLKFAETYFTAAGDREFNVAINGATELTQLDLYASAGGENVALDEVYNNIAPSGGLITITFGPSAINNAEVQAIQIIPQGSVTPSPSPTHSPTPNPSGPRLVGYLPDYDGSYSTFATTLDFTKMTHLVLCFALPPACPGGCTAGSNMAFSLGQSDAEIAALVNAAHAAGVKVMVSIGGGDNATDDLISAFYNAGLSPQLVASLDSYVTAHNLDGVDVDIEDPANMGAPYATFVADLIAKEHAGGRQVSAAVANWLQTQNVMTNATLQSFDFINIMTYADLSSCQSDLAYFASLGEPHNKMVLGVPFYGQADNGASETFGTIVGAYPNAGQSNASGGGSLDGGVTFNYVGFSEMAQETLLGVQYGGVMIWELSQDAPPPNSLLNVIQNNL
ncbi:MAG TPA: malectin domain-containing carbohydrate-binding protein [bacterium]|nr:malectin domain-containing carbohydrate-binding protein [bacterium]